MPRPCVVRCASCGAINRVDLDRIAAGPKCARCATVFALDHPLKATDADFRQIVGGASVPVVVDFYADWCGPCRAMAPALDAFARTQAGQALVFKLDTEANPVTPSQFNIQGIPTLIAFKDGKEHRRHVGMANQAALAALVAG